MVEQRQQIMISDRGNAIWVRWTRPLEETDAGFAFLTELPEVYGIDRVSASRYSAIVYVADHVTSFREAKAAVAALVQNGSALADDFQGEYGYRVDVTVL